MEWGFYEENKIKRSVSSNRLNIVNPNYNLREARSCTGTVDDIKINPYKPNMQQHEHSTCYEEQYLDQNKVEEKGLETREVTSNQIFVVKDEMLTYRGKRYSLSDIAIKWKKDCRTWLWKSQLNKKRNKSLNELRESKQKCN